MAKALSIAAIFEQVDKAADPELELRKLANPTVGKILQYAFGPYEWALPEMPDEPAGVVYKPSELHDLEGMLYMETRRLYLFHKGGNDRLKDGRRQMLFTQMLESIDKRDAALICNIVSKRWPYKNITRELIDKIEPGLIADGQE